MPDLKLTEKGIVNLIKEQQAGILGPSSAWALEFYADPWIAVKNPSAYVVLLRNLLGAGAENLLSQLTKSLYRKVGMDSSRESSLEECIRKIRLN